MRYWKNDKKGCKKYFKVIFTDGNECDYNKKAILLQPSKSMIGFVKLIDAEENIIAIISTAFIKQVVLVTEVEREEE